MASYTGNRLELDEDIVEFSHKIQKMVESGSTVIVLLELTPETEPRNVIGIDRSGNELWKIESNDAPDGERRTIYTGLWKDGEDVMVSDYHGRDYNLNTKTGNTDKVRRRKF